MLTPAPKMALFGRIPRAGGVKVCSAEAAAFCGLVLVFGSKLVSCDAAGLPFGMVSEPRRRLEPTLAGSLVEYLAVKNPFSGFESFG